MKRLLKIGFVVDPLESFNQEAETTHFILKESTNRRHENWVMEPKDIFWDQGTCGAMASRILVVKRGKLFSHRIVDQKKINLGRLDVVFLRKDPPVDAVYLNHLTLLEMLEKSDSSKPPFSPFFINSPSGIKRANEKLYPFYFPEISPPSLVSANIDLLLEFLSRQKKVVMKPLNLGGGKGVLILHAGDADRRSLLEMATQNGREYMMLQKFIPESVKGDKRILLFNGEILGAFVRVPSKNDFRGNLHSGARFKKSAVTAHEREIIYRLKSRLIRDGLYFVGIDFIGPTVTEINTTSPMGIREINYLDQVHIEKKILNFVESKVHFIKVP